MTDTCVCCGAPVPEGRMVCPLCEYANEETSEKIDDGSTEMNEEDKASI